MVVLSCFDTPQVSVRGFSRVVVSRITAFMLVRDGFRQLSSPYKYSVSSLEISREYLDIRSSAFVYAWQLMVWQMKREWEIKKQRVNCFWSKGVGALADSGQRSHPLKIRLIPAPYPLKPASAGQLSGHHFQR